MTNVSGLTVGQSHIFQVFQAAKGDHFIGAGGSHIDFIFQSSNKIRKVSILIARHNAPGAGVIAVNAGTDVLDNQIQRIAAGILCYIYICSFLQQRQIEDKCFKIFNVGGFQLGDLHIGGVGASTAILVGFPTHCVKGRHFGLVLGNAVTPGRNLNTACQCHSAEGAISTGSHTRILAQCGNFLADHRVVGMSVILCIGEGFLNNSRFFHNRRLLSRFCCGLSFFCRFRIRLLNRRIFGSLRVTFCGKYGERHHRKHHHQYKQCGKATLCKIFKHCL